MQVITHNMTARFANKQLGIIGYEKSKSLEKLSSGYKLNRSADNAASLFISEKMRWQKRGLKTSSRNIQDAISLVQIAEGALNESQNLLQRINELSIQATNDTNTYQDRMAIQQEVNALVSEIDRIANQTCFNEELYPLLKKVSSSDNEAQEVAPEQYEVQGGGATLPPNMRQSTVTFTFSGVIGDTGRVVSNIATIDGRTYHNGDSISVTGMTENGQEIRFYGGLYDRSAGRLTAYSNSISTFYSLYESDLGADTEGHIYYTDRDSLSKYVFIRKDGDNSPDPIACGMESTTRFYVQIMNYEYYQSPDQNIDAATYTVGSSTEEENEEEEEAGIWIQTGALEGQGIQIYTVDSTARGLGIERLNVGSFESASSAIEKVNAALDKVSFFRSHFGSVQNRLECARKTNENTAENTDAAQSRIRDTDMAKEMVRYSAYSVLEQAGQSILAQANQMNREFVRLIMA